MALKLKDEELMKALEEKINNASPYSSANYLTGNNSTTKKVTNPYTPASIPVTKTNTNTTTNNTTNTTNKTNTVNNALSSQYSSNNYFLTNNNTDKTTSSVLDGYTGINNQLISPYSSSNYFLTNNTGNTPLDVYNTNVKKPVENASNSDNAGGDSGSEEIKLSGNNPYSYDVPAPTWDGGKYSEAMMAAMDAINNREQFSYDLNADALYQQYKNQYLTQGNLAMQDTLGKAAALTGGYGNSYAVTAGNQAYQSYVDKLNNVVPELYQLAYDKYNNETNELYNRYNLAKGAYDTEYGEYRDKYTDWYNERNFDYNKYNDDYTKAQNESKAQATALANQQKEQEEYENSYVGYVDNAISNNPNNLAYVQALVKKHYSQGDISDEEYKEAMAHLTEAYNKWSAETGKR